MADDDAPVPSGPLIPNTTREKPEWDLWTSVPNANLWAAVALSCDFHPDSVHFLDEREAADLRQYWKRYTALPSDSSLPSNSDGCPIIRGAAMTSSADGYGRPIDAHNMDILWAPRLSHTRDR
jgi:hypothetical protein